MPQCNSQSLALTGNRLIMIEIPIYITINQSISTTFTVLFLTCILNRQRWSLLTWLRSFTRPNHLRGQSLKKFLYILGSFGARLTERYLKSICLMRYCLPKAWPS